MKRKKIIQYYCICTFLFNGILGAQVKLDGQFFDYATYYISNIDLSTGQSDVPLYRYRIHDNNRTNNVEKVKKFDKKIGENNE